MNVNQINEALLAGRIDETGIFPHLDSLKLNPFVFAMDFGFPRLHSETGIILIRGARQYGKSTWLEQHLRQCIVDFGAGSALYLNGDELRTATELVQQVRTAISLFNPKSSVKRIYIDEITAVSDWQKGLKRLADAGELRGILIITTGSKATDLRRGTERLPGRKGRLARTTYYFTPLSYSSFRKETGELLGNNTVPAYILSGGCPLAAAEIARNGIIPEFVTEMIRDWIYGDCSASGRDRASLLGVMEVLIRYGGSPTGQAKVAREAGLANNTVAAGFLELLMDNLCLATAFAWDAERRVALRRKPAKFHFINLLAAVAWHPDHPSSVDEYRALPAADHGKLHEWTVAQELWRRAARAGAEVPEQMLFWQSKEHEIDFIADGTHLIEVKYGKVSPIEFSWFPRVFPAHRLTVINTERFETAFCRGVTLEDFLLEAS